MPCQEAKLLDSALEDIQALTEQILHDLSPQVGKEHSKGRGITMHDLHDQAGVYGLELHLHKPAEVDIYYHKDTKISVLFIFFI